MLPGSLCMGCLTVLICHGNLFWLCSAGFWHGRELSVSFGSWLLPRAGCVCYLCTTWLWVLSQPRATHTQLRVPKGGFSIRRLLSGLPSVVNGDRERGFQGVIQRIRNCRYWEPHVLRFPLLSFSVTVINFFHIHYNGEHWQREGIFIWFLATSELLFSVFIAFSDISAFIYFIKRHKDKDSLRLLLILVARNTSALMILLRLLLLERKLVQEDKC